MRIPIVVIALLALSAPAWAEPLRVRFTPDLVARDVTGQPVQVQSLLRGPRTLLVAITDRKSGNRLRAWFDAAERLAWPSENWLSIISLGLPGFVSDGYAREKVREKIPQRYWHQSLMDRDHRLASILGLPRDKLPTAIVLDGACRVVAAFHGDVGSPGAGAIWQALAQGSTSELLSAPRTE